MKMVDLFSGIGGFSLAASWTGIETVAFCEIDEFCRDRLSENFPGVPIYADIRELTASMLQAGTVDIICGGFPCQPYSRAGKRNGTADDRNLWPEMFRLVEELRPPWVVGENVDGIVDMELDNVLADLEGAGYACRAFVVPAVAVDAKSIRSRVWIVAADADRDGCDGPGISIRSGEQGLSSADLGWRYAPSADFDGFGFERRGCVSQATGSSGWIHAERAFEAEWWEARAGILRMVDGLPDRMDKTRIKALGNSVVPLVVYRFFKAIKAIHDGKEV